MGVEEEKVRAHLRIEGRVQGVYFRSETRERALRLGLTGWVRNRGDGSVEVVFEGPLASVQEIIAWCHEGPPDARVTNVEVKWEAYRGEFPGFSVVYN